MNLAERLKRLRDTAAIFIGSRVDPSGDMEPEELPQSLRPAGGAPAPPFVAPEHELDALVAQAWDAWLPRFKAAVSEPPQPVSQASIVDVVLAAMELEPSSHLRTDLSQVAPAEWNALVLRALPAPRRAQRATHANWVAPGWVLAMALHQLGFGGPSLRLGREAAPETREAANDLIEMIVGRETGRPGLLVIELRPGFIAPTTTGLYPMLSVSVNALPRLGEALRAMFENGAFLAIIVETAYDTGVPNISGIAGNLEPILINRKHDGAPVTMSEIDERVLLEASKQTQAPA